MDLSSPSDESKVLIVYTGGTIGMLSGPQGFVPEPYFLTETLRCQTRFHDPLQASLFSNASSVQGFRDWSKSGRNSPIAVTPPNEREGDVLLVRSSRPIGTPRSLAPESQPASVPQPMCTKVAENVFEARLPALVTPRSSAPGGSGKRIRYAVLEWNPLLDSSNIENDDWIRIATEIELNYYAFDAFVVLHGTDTMAYTSSALSFLLEDLGKTVILTGAQIPLSQLRNDAVDNLLGALVIAGHFIIPEVSLFFNHVLYRGNRVSKSSSFDLEAYSSPNFPPLVNVGIDVIVNWDHVIRQTSIQRFRAHKDLSANVATLRLFPGITATTVRAFMAAPTRGVVLETFGAGNAPQRKDLMDVLKEGCDRGVVVVAISQCAKGSVSDAYETGRTLLDTGVVAGGDMTPECALTKLGYLLSKPSLTPAKVRELISKPIRGELTRRAYAAAAPTSARQTAQDVDSLLAEVVRLSATPGSAPGIPTIALSPVTEDVAPEFDAAPWSATAAEAAATQAALFPFLIHTAAARDDLGGIAFCLRAADPSGSDSHIGLSIPGGIVNCREPASGRSPLHTAALNGGTRSVGVLLEAGALVHLRDALGHTALYYAARQGHEHAVETLMKAGANLGGSDIEGGFAALAMKKAARVGDQTSLRIWEKAGEHIKKTP